MGMPGKLDHTQEKLHKQTAASMDILFHTKSKLSTHIVFEILKPDWLRAFSITTQKATRFFTAIWFL